MPQGFYVTVIRDSDKGSRVGWLLGPYNSEPEAREHIAEARTMAEEIDPRCAWDRFGVTGLARPGELPRGVLTALRDAEREA